MNRPLGMLAELTYRCPLRCGYCSNPTGRHSRSSELTTQQWCQVFEEARELGVLQVYFSGGEPLLRRDLPGLVAHARRLGLYTSLITGGQGMSADRLADLVASGLDHVQISLQDADAPIADAIAGRAVHRHKLTAARLVKEVGLPLTLNVVLHRANIGHTRDLIDLALRLRADRLELANAQYYGSALLNLPALVPSRAQLDAAETLVQEARDTLAHRLEIVYVRSDLHDAVPKPCMHGWGSRQLTVTPSGDVLPCPAAARIPGLDVPNVRQAALADIWFHSAAFNRFRGTAWMPEPCRSCPLKEDDHGGCRCQAFQLAGDPAATDPACRLSPHHALVRTLLQDAESAPDTLPYRA